MNTYRQLIYMVLDQLKLVSDDSHFNESHILYLADKMRAFLVERKYSSGKLDIPETNYQEICLDLEETDVIEGTACGGVYLKSIQRIPATAPIGTKMFYTDVLTNYILTYVPLERMPYVGTSKWMKNFIYATKGPDSYLYLKSSNPLFVHLEKVRFKAVFADTEKAAQLQCDGNGELACDVMDREFPLEETLITPLIQLIVQELSGHKYLPADTENNAKDDLHGVMNPNSRNTSRRAQYEENPQS